MKNQLENEVQKFLSPFIEMSLLSGVQFPLLSTTYSLWRKVGYKQMRQKYGFEKNSQQEKQLKRAFIQVSQRKLLPQFLVKVNQQIDGKSVGWRRAILQAEELKSINSPYYNELLLEYCQQLYQLQLYIELFYDLVSIPYTQIFSENKQYLLNQKYKSSFYSKKDQNLVDKACEKIGKNIISKGLGKLSETLLSNRFIYSVTGILSTFNPLAFAASLSISYAMEEHQKTSKQKNIVSELQFLKNMIQKNLVQLKQTYEMCLTSIQIMAEVSHNQNELLQRQKKKFFEILSTVLTQDWLQIKITKQGQWEFVQLNNKFSFQQFQDIHLTKSRQQKI